MIRKSCNRSIAKRTFEVVNNLGFTREKNQASHSGLMRGINYRICLEKSLRLELWTAFLQ